MSSLSYREILIGYYVQSRSNVDFECEISVFRLRRVNPLVVVYAARYTRAHLSIMDGDKSAGSPSIHLIANFDEKTNDRL